MIDPDQFIISRKRKKYRFALFSNAQSCFELEEWERRHIDVVELGAGTGLFCVELASRHPDKQFLAVDVKADRLQRGAYQAIERSLTNIYFLRARVDQITDFLSSGSVETLWLTFPDPFPRERSTRRRMTHSLYLEKYKAILKKNGAFKLKHDDPSFFNWSLEQLVDSKWHINELRFDLHVSELPDDYKITTTYETRWLSEGKATHFVAALPPE